MKFNELKLLFMAEMDKIDADPSKKKYIVGAYRRVLKILGENEGEVSEAKINSLNLTQHMKDKLIKLSKKSIKDVDKKKILREELKQLLGIGDRKVDELLEAGLKNINQLRQKKYFELLNEDTKMMLRYKPVRKIPRVEILKIEKKLTNFTKAKVLIVGSFRRLKPTSTDIDIMVVSNQDCMGAYVNYLKKQFDEIVLYSKGPDKISLLIKVDRGTYYKVDVFRTPLDIYHSMLLYASGPKEFNIRMRGKAKRQGLLLNQEGLFRNGKKINKPEDNEERLFELLGMKYLNPWERR